MESELQEKLADLIGNKRAALLRGHGIVVVGNNIEEMLYACLTLEDDTRKAAQAIALGELQFFSPEECRQFESTVSLEFRARRAWTYFPPIDFTVFWHLRLSAWLLSARVRWRCPPYIPGFQRAGFYADPSAWCCQPGEHSRRRKL